MSPGDLLREVKRRLHPAQDPCRVRVSDQSHDHRFPSLWCGEEEVMAWPRDEVPEHSIFTWLCQHPECAQTGTEPFVCRRGDPPQGIERRGLEFLSEPGNCGHTVQRRLVCRGAEATLKFLEQWRDEQGRPLLRQTR